MMRSKGSATAEVNLVVVSDLHAGCRLGIMPPAGMTLDDGGMYKPSNFQRKTWAMWREFWDEWVPLVTKNEPFGVVINGDLVDGSHHGSTTQVSQNPADQETIAYDAIAPLVDRCAGRLWIIRGTEAHGGKSGVDEERLARRIGSIPNEQGQSARWELWKRVGPALVHLTHHIGTTGSHAYESSSVHKELTEALVEAGRWREEPPQVVVRSHRHRYIKTEMATAAGPAYSVVTPSWQGRTPFAYRVPGARQSPPQFGGIVIRAVRAPKHVTDTGDDPVKVLARVWRIERSREE